MAGDDTLVGGCGGERPERARSLAAPSRIARSDSAIFTTNAIGRRSSLGAQSPAAEGSNGFGLCAEHRHDPKRVVQPLRPIRRSAGRLLAWGRLSLRSDAARAVAEEANRRGVTPSGLMADIVEAWATARAEGPPSRRLTVCRGPRCEKAVYARGLCHAHRIQELKRQPLRPIQERVEDQVVMGSLRLPVALAERLKTAAKAEGLSLTATIRRSLATSLEDTTALAVERAEAWSPDDPTRAVPASCEPRRAAQRDGAITRRPRRRGGPTGA